MIQMVAVVGNKYMRLLQMYCRIVFAGLKSVVVSSCYPLRKEKEKLHCFHM